ncbi:MAG: glycosyltransferase, partial [Cyclobacteriaceae bacterium]|nr:glycosyltransferase [Cyclobacteriaceae bacterium]
MRVLVTGQYDEGYNRTLILLQGLRSNGVEVEELPIKGKRAPFKERILKASEKADLVYLPPFTHADVTTIKKWINKPLVFDPLVSKYLTKVFDYRQVWRFSPRALKNYFKDKIPFNRADLLLSDTEAHKEYFHKTFNIPLEKIEVVPVGVDTEVFYPEESKRKSESTFVVGFYGGFIPLHGTRTILEAAELLQGEDIRFEMLGDGFEYEKALAFVGQKNMKNINFRGHIPYLDLPAWINSFDICLGIFGTTPKSNFVVPNKIFHYTACNKYVISKDSSAM